MLKAIIFDMDGVLIDSISAVWESYSRLLRHEGVTITKAYIRQNLARSLRDNLTAMREEFGIRDYDPAEFSKASAKIQLELLAEKKADPHLIALLESARAAGIVCAVGTSSMRWRAEEILRLLKIRAFFAQVITADDVERHKPAPDVFLEAAHRSGVDPKHCVVIEDAGEGILAAHHAGMKAVGLLTAYHSAEELAHADRVIGGFSDLSLELLEDLCKHTVE